jgi:EspG family
VTGEGMAAVRFGPVEFDLLATYARAAIPYPLQVPSFGRFPGERDLLFGVAGDTLRQRDLADEDGPVGLGDELVVALSARRGTVDLVLGGPGHPMGFVAIVHRDDAVVCLQILDSSTAEPVQVRHAAAGDLPRVIAGLIPPLPGAKILPVRVPTVAVRELYQLRARSGDRLGNELYQIASAHGCSADDLDTLIEAADAATGGGQLGATTVSEHGRDARTGAELSWLDGPGGRLRIVVETSGGTEWMSVNPLHPRELYAAITEMVTLVRRHRPLAGARVYA